MIERLRAWPAAAALSVALATPAAALERPDPGELERLARDKQLQQRLANAEALGNHRVKPQLAASAAYRLSLQLWRQGATDREPTPPPAWRGMPTKGTVRLFALLIAFSDYAPYTPASTIDGKLFGDGDGVQPYESLRNFYRRSSYSQLELAGATLGWYTTAYPRSSVSQTTAGREAVIKEALNAMNASGHDFSQYDNDGDGRIDYFMVLWTGPDNGWANFWWGYQTGFSDGTYLLDGKRLGDYSWQWEGRPVGTAFTPRVVIHETGHALGVPDYYDYDDTVGPRGGVGGLDQMDANWGDHNCFSKFLLDWITPTVIAGGTNLVTLRSSGTNRDAVLFAKGATGQAFTEYFMVQNRTRTANDTPFPGDGLLVWHVDATLNAGGSSYVYDNSSTAHKLLRLMEADGLEQIESGYSANAGDYYLPPRSIGPATLPSIARYDAVPNPMQVVSISAAGATMTAHVDEIADATPPTGAPSTPTDEGATKAGERLVFSWTQGTAADPESGIAGYELQIGTSPGTADSSASLGNVLAYTLTGAVDGRTYYARVRAVNALGMPSAWSGWSDGITVALPAFPCAALDECGLAFTTSGDAGWFEEAGVVYYGSSAGQAGAVTHGQSSYVQAAVTGPGTLGFWWAVSSEAGWDFLRFTVDGTAAATPISGTVGWTQQTLSIPAGPHVLRWTYSKDPSVSAGSDTGWLDKVSWTAVPASCGNDVGLVGDSRTAAVQVPAAGTQWLQLPVHGGVSYAVEVRPVSGTPPGSVTLFRYEDGCSGASTASWRDVSTIEPGGPSGVRLAFTASAPTSAYRLRFANPGAAAGVYEVTLVETSLFSASWTTSGSYETYYSLQNTTGSPLTVQLALVRTDGGVAATTTVSVPAGATAATNTAALGLASGLAGTARVSHDGPPGALVAEAVIANFSLSPAYVQPVKLTAVRDRR